MTTDQARALVLVLRAAFPRPEWDKATQALYVAEFSRIPDAEAAQNAVQIIIRNSEFRPSIAQVLSEYRDVAVRKRMEADRARALPAAAPPPAFVPEEVIRWMQEHDIPVASAT